MYYIDLKDLPMGLCVLDVRLKGDIGLKHLPSSLPPLCISDWLSDLAFLNSGANEESVQCSSLMSSGTAHGMGGNCDPSRAEGGALHFFSR